MPRDRGLGRGGRRPTRVRLPARTTTEARALLDLLARVSTALWRAHGAAMAERDAMLGVETPRPPGARWVGRRGPLPDDDGC